MKKLFPILLLLIGLFAAGCQEKRSAQESHFGDTTTIYLVRHAEKDLQDKGQDPALTTEGKARAQRLPEVLEGIPLHAIYSTSFQRNLNTVKPLADQRGLRVQLYEGQDSNELVKELPENYRGETVLICGHSNTLLPMIKELGLTPPLDSIGDSEHDKLFKVEISRQDTTLLMTTF